MVTWYSGAQQMSLTRNNFFLLVSRGRKENQTLCLVDSSAANSWLICLSCIDRIERYNSKQIIAFTSFVLQSRKNLPVLVPLPKIGYALEAFQRRFIRLITGMRGLPYQEGLSRLGLYSWDFNGGDLFTMGD